MADITSQNILFRLDEDQLNTIDELVTKLDEATRMLIDEFPSGIVDQDYAITDDLANKYRRILTTIHTLEYYERSF